MDSASSPVRSPRGVAISVASSVASVANSGGGHPDTGGQEVGGMNERDGLHLEVGKDGMAVRRGMHARINTAADAFQIQAIQRQMLEGQTLGGPGADPHMSTSDLVPASEVMGVMGADQQRLVAEIMQSGSLMKSGYYAASTGPSAGGAGAAPGVSDTSAQVPVSVSYMTTGTTSGGEERQTYELAEQLLSHPLNPDLFGASQGGSTGGHHHDLTDEDRRLVSALVAVQMAQQQKHQQEATTAAAAMVPSTVAQPTMSQATMPSTMTPTTMVLPKHQYLKGSGMSGMYSGGGGGSPTGTSFMSNGATQMQRSHESDELSLPLSPSVIGVMAPAQSANQGHSHTPPPNSGAPQHHQAKLEPLPPLKKVLAFSTRGNVHDKGSSMNYVLSSQSMARLLGANKKEFEEHGLLVEGDEMDVVDEHDVDDDGKKVKEEPSEVLEGEEKDFLLDTQSEGKEGEMDSDALPMEENETDDELAEEEEDEEFEGMGEEGEDGEEDEEDTKPSRRSTLPHKKRIPRKLKQPKAAKATRIHSRCYKCNKCGEQFPSQQAYSAHKETHARKLFTCEICTKGFAQQLRFFEHLKAHYEAGLEADLVEDLPPRPPRSQKPSPLHPPHKHPSSHHPHQPTPTQTHLPKPHPNTLQPTLTHLPPTPTSAPAPAPTQQQHKSLRCDKCDKSFRREKAYDAHMQSFHPPAKESPRSDSESRAAAPDKHVILAPPSSAMPPPTPPASGSNSESSRSGGGVGVGVVGGGGGANVGRSGRPKRTVHRMEPEELRLEPDFTDDPLADVRDDDDDDLGADLGGGEPESEAHMCYICNEDFPTKAKLSSHLRKSHGEPRKRKKSVGKKEILTCPKCGRVFNHRNSLVYHLRSHTGERPHQCEMCGKSFFASSALKVHMRLHSGEKPYKCEYCGRHFRQWGDLKYHCISIHTDERQYQCEFCGKDFARKYSLIVHRRIHTGERNYKCEFCGKCFRAASYLQNHRRIHTGEKPHPCGICGKPFRVRSDMKRHMQTHNRESGQGGASQARNLVAMAANAAAVASVVGGNGNGNGGGNAAHIGLGQSHTPVSQHDLVAGPQITIEESAEAIITGDALSQPVSLSITVPQRSLDGPHGNQQQGQTQQQQQLAQGVQEEVLSYTRGDPMDSVTIREGNSGTLYVWPVFMN